MSDSDSNLIKNKKLVIACGGTGGHLFPGIAVAEAWTQAGGDVLILISEKQIDTLATEGYDHLRFERLPSIAMPKLLSLKMISFGFKFLNGLRACRKLLKSFQADAVLGMGGFTSAAPLLAGKLAGLPTFVHESNAIPGRANKLNAKFARTVLVGFERCAKHFGEAKKTETVGTPLRPAVAEIPDAAVGRAHFGLDENRKTIMVMGGSQGAQRVNELVADAIKKLPLDKVQVLHITGPSDFDATKPAFDATPEAGKVIAFCSDIQFAYAAADLAICRSGASTLTELAHYGVPSILIPYPYAADDHQTRNAEIFSDPGAAEMWTQNEIDEDNFADRLATLILDEPRMAEMKTKMKALAIPDASDRVCQVVAREL
ncbi:undecaprenyldiphospho-muramoylpentapeptide beta-N-acetylglucosaminyltransferase [Verrucomicrobiales bacterium]|nr:undecaprenyldiphospho-muramoylpentapeptide beta-N-acetylglucosaminyltransferase [Verrucomicrobiales bacterium]MDC0322311.1 undecaprenyldiphospho-muramoylpentapeptide beta-N-acetylglucosaminyltransferase [Verrucomicrobiales bacterium]